MKSLTSQQKIIFENIIEEAIVDCYGEDEQISGWMCFLDDKISTPHNCLIGKEHAILEKIDMDEGSRSILGIIKVNKMKIRMPLQDVILENLELMEYLKAYTYWLRGY